MKAKKHLILSIQLLMCIFYLTVLSSPVQSQTVTIGLGNGSGLPGTSDNPFTVSLGNSVIVNGLQMNICETPATPNNLTVTPQACRDEIATVP